MAGEERVCEGEGAVGRLGWFAQTDLLELYNQRAGRMSAPMLDLERKPMRWRPLRFSGVPDPPLTLLACDGEQPGRDEKGAVSSRCPCLENLRPCPAAPPRLMALGMVCQCWRG